MARAPADWITLADAAGILGGANIRVHPETVGRWARDGRLQTLKIGGRRYVRRAEIRALLRPRPRTAATAPQPGLFEEF